MQGFNSVALAPFSFTLKEGTLKYPNLQKNGDSHNQLGVKNKENVEVNKKLMLLHVRIGLFDVTELLTPLIAIINVSATTAFNHDA